MQIVKKLFQKTLKTNDLQEQSQFFFIINQIYF